MIYVPRGFTPLKTCVVSLAQRRRPDLPFSDYLLYLDAQLMTAFDPHRTARGYDPFCDAPSSKAMHNVSLMEQVYCFTNLGHARNDLRLALAENEMPAVGMLADGDLHEIPQKYWRTDAGAWRLQFVDRKDDYIHVFINTDTFQKWLEGGGAEEAVEDSSAPKMSADTRRHVMELLMRALETPDGRNTPKPQHFARVQMTTAITNSDFNSIWAEIAKKPGYEGMVKAGRKPRRTIDDV
ncbi:hypothetical protein [Tanticharoenia sakaeratensis]|uniref:Uncharacterized protein n=1 Tax=Tanticharoenia sakaeratensis NBRC 103193 TaxID=1231623 RepID=A0A0D6MQA3_9PROT|nr:hypothetical protein [Tanticharoenia sakaeratensis]GAN55458.1 hypothetical protein Tasa_048_083 [Tanticharoenia sakaeratensis NBRC 103193]GBQ22017.1 hypothetical protein AA103193_1928 [Tanticharoenia sakaeratensis NBRC 103193]